MRQRSWGALLGIWILAGSACDVDDGRFGPSDPPAAPRALEARYHAYAVHLTWELAPQWDGESFRVYAKRTSDPDWFLIADVTSCTGGFCRFSDVNVVAGATYDYYVAAVSRSGEETPSPSSVRVSVPQPVPPAVPVQVRAIALDDANYVRWDPNARDASDFSHYRVWLWSEGESYLLGETDSEGFLDLLAQNGFTYSYFVTSVDLEGHESDGSQAGDGTPRPDFTSEWVYDHFSAPGSSGFRFQETEDANPIVHGSDASRHFRLEVDDAGWWLVPGPNTSVYPSGFLTTALKCGVAADAGCEALDVAPTSGYVAQDVGLAPQSTYVMRVLGDDGQPRYGAIRVQLLGFDGEDRPIMIFDWAYQLQSGNPNLAPKMAETR